MSTARESHSHESSCSKRRGGDQHTDRVTAQLLFNPFERLFHTQPKVNLLTGRAAGHIAIELSHVLYLLDPAVDLALELVEKARVGEQG